MSKTREQQDPTGATHEFMRAARVEAESRGISLAAAIRSLARARPDLHAAYVESIPAVRKRRTA